MINYIIRRLLIAVPVLLLMVMATFALINAVPGGPFDASGQKKMPDHIVVIMERQYGLDKPLYEQFGRYLVKLAQGDMGPLLQSRVRNVNDVVKDTFPVSFQLGIMAVVLGIAIGIPAGIIAALRHNTVIDYTATFFAVLFASIPNLVLAPLLILIFALSLGWFPIAFWGAEPPFILGIFPKPSSTFFHHAALPVIVLGTGSAAAITRLTRAGLLDVLSADYIRTARAKGLHERAVIIIHALKNSLIPVATILGPLFAAAVTGSLIVEQIFAINGMGRRFISSLSEREYFLLTGLTLIYGAILILGNLFVDILYAWLDPRIRYD